MSVTDGWAFQDGTTPDSGHFGTIVEHNESRADGILRPGGLASDFMTARRLSTFLVEDSPLLRSQVTELLEELAPVIVVDVAEDETGALDWLAHDGNHCDVVVVDIFLKRGNGLIVLQNAVKLRPDAHFVVLSNAATPDVRRWCYQLGARAVFDKSTEIDDLLQYCLGLASDNR